ncbi:MAG: glycosyltransferase family 4 protein [Firmicutes bacterium]|nr:glycosyltransferase family 4 protein [Bacillota bacterium]
MKRIGLLFTGSENWLGGVYYIKNIILALNNNTENEKHYLVLIVPPWISKSLYSDLSANIEILFYPDKKSIESRYVMLHRVFRKIRSLLGKGYDYSFSKILINNRIDVIYPVYSTLTKKFPVPWIAWVPDLQHKFYSQYFTAKQIKEREKNYKSLANDASKIIFSSYDALNTFHKYYSFNKSKLFVLQFRSIIDTEYQNHNFRTNLGKYNLPGNYFCVSNQWWAHKNHIVVLNAIILLLKAGTNINVVFTGKTFDHRNEKFFEQMKCYIKDNEIDKNVRILGLIPRTDQLSIMKNSLGIIQPSKFEGWSTVVEDAQALGKKIIISDIPVNKEQAPANAVYFNPDNPTELSNLLKMISCGQFVDEEPNNDRYKSLIKKFSLDFLNIVEE